MKYNVLIATYPFGLCGDEHVKLLEQTGWNIKYNSLENVNSQYKKYISDFTENYLDSDLFQEVQDQPVNDFQISAILKIFGLIA